MLGKSVITSIGPICSICFLKCPAGHLSELIFKHYLQGLRVRSDEELSFSILFMSLTLATHLNSRIGHQGRKFRCNFVPLYIGPVLHINLIATGLKTILHMLGSLL